MFEGKLVVSGGLNDNFADISNVESYDVFAGKWSRMPSMCAAKHCHGLVVAQNKMFAIAHGKNNCEVFEDSCRKFAILKIPELKRDIWWLSKAVSIGCKIFVFTLDTNSFFVFDVNKKRWSKKYFNIDVEDFSCVKLPWF